MFILTFRESALIGVTRT